jgi:hypothetical protein
MDQKDRESMMDKIKGLLSKTVENGATQEEAMAAMAVAQRMMDKYNIALAEVFATDGVVDFETQVVHESKSADGHWRCAIGIVENAFAVKTFYRRDKCGRCTTKVAFVVYGDRANVENAEWATKFLARLVKRLWVEFRTANPANDSWAQMNAFFAGIRRGFKDRLEAERRQTERENPSARNAIVLVNTKVEEAFRAANPDIVTSKRRIAGGQAYNAGIREGGLINLRRPVGGGHGPKALS